MAHVPHPIPALLATKTVWIENPLLPGTWIKKVLQRVAPGTGNVGGVPGLTLQLRAHVVPADPRTPIQLAQRTRFRDAQIAWYALTQPEKNTYTTRGALRALTGRQLFTREYIAKTPAVILPGKIRLLWSIKSANTFFLSEKWPLLAYQPYTFDFF